MKSLIITLLAVFATATTAMAQRVGKAYSMHVNTTDGNSTEYKFINEPVATFSDGSMTIKTMAGKGVAFVLDNVKNITFSALATTIDGTTTDGSKLSVSASDSEMEICGARPGDKVAVYDAAGKLCASASADGNGRAVIGISNLGKGVFVVNTPANSIKFIK